MMRSLLADAAIERMGETGLLGDVESTGQIKRDDPLSTILDRFSSRVVRAAKETVPVYAIYFCFENSVREFVAETMRENHGDDWWDKVPQKIRSAVEARKKQLEKHKWYTYDPPSNVSQLLFGDLSSIITDQWSIFEPFFPGQDFVRIRLNELEMSRNVIAHGNRLPDDEVERLKQYLNDWLRQVPT